jgi:hypothetical protein
MRFAPKARKPKVEKPLEPALRAKVNAWKESALSLAARRHGVVLTPGQQRSLDGERIRGPRGFVYEGWSTFSMWLPEPPMEDVEVEQFLLSDDTTLPIRPYSDEIEKCIQQALAAGLEQHDRPDHAHFFRWNASDDDKTAIALKIIGARRNDHDPTRVELPQAPDCEIYIEPRPYRKITPQVAYGKKARKRVSGPGRE